MPGSTTHTYICYQALKSLSSADGYAPFANIAKSHEAAIALSKANKPKDLKASSASVLSGCAYIGSCGPDLFYIEYDREGEFLADLLHYNRSGPFIVRWLVDLKARARQLRTGKRPALERQLAYCLGHISHIAADITIHPYVNSIVGAYPENQKVFKNARGVLFWKTPWKFHNILEHYQDAYILHDRFIGEEKLGSDPECVNFAAPAAAWLRTQASSEWIGFVKQAKAFYRHTTTLDIEKYKYDFFANENTVVNIGGYYSDVIPDAAMMRLVPKLTQGKVPDGHGGFTPGVFDDYVARAVQLTQAMWSEVRTFLDTDTAVIPAHASPNLHRLSKAELDAFPLLSGHWNLDCGLAPRVNAGGQSMAVPGNPDSSLSVPGGLELVSAHPSGMDDFK